VSEFSPQSPARGGDETFVLFETIIVITKALLIAQLRQPDRPSQRQGRVWLPGMSEDKQFVSMGQ